VSDGKQQGTLGNTIDGYHIVLYDSSGQLVQSAFANEQGTTFTLLTSRATYYVYPEDCNLCHGSNHDVVFQYWGVGSSTTSLAPSRNEPRRLVILYQQLRLGPEYRQIRCLATVMRLPFRFVYER
jgi:hypothetical protein